MSEVPIAPLTVRITDADIALMRAATTYSTDGHEVSVDLDEDVSA